MADDIQYMTDAEIEATWGKGSAAKIREQDRLKRLATQETFVAENQPVPPSRRNRDRNQPPPPPVVDGGSMDMIPMPSNRSVGGIRKKNEGGDEMAFRMNQGLPRGARQGGGGGVGQALLMNEGGMGVEEARIKSNIISSRGGRIVKRDDGSLATESTTARKAPQSSTGRDYDPVAERKAILANAKAAVDERKNLQKSDAILARKQFAASQVPDTMRGFANQYGSGQAKTLSKEEFANRAPGMVTEGRNFPVTNKITEVVDWMKKDQRRK